MYGHPCLSIPSSKSPNVLSVGQLPGHVTIQFNSEITSAVINGVFATTAAHVCDSIA